MDSSSTTGEHRPLRPFDETAPEREVTGFRQDAEGHWIAELECGHAQHVRHDPPWQRRPWVLTAGGRAGRLGSMLRCMRCLDAGAPEPAP